MNFIFDVDGTLTPSRGHIDNEFAIWFGNFCETHNVYLVTGSDKSKTIEQIGEYIYSKCKRVYNCNGNDIWEDNLNVRTNKWTLPEAAHDWLSEQLTSSKFRLRTGLHFEHRAGMVNFSIVGRNANKEQRAEYVVHDKLSNERNIISNNFNLLFPTLQATVGGETGIDITPRGADKSQVLADFDPQQQIHFFGDAMHPQGNDYPLSKLIIDNNRGMCYNVIHWRDTWTHLKTILSQP
jgi:phosphomannomutase